MGPPSKESLSPCRSDVGDVKSGGVVAGEFGYEENFSKGGKRLYSRAPCKSRQGGGASNFCPGGTTLPRDPFLAWVSGGSRVNISPR